MYWRYTPLNDLLPRVERPTNSPTDVLLLKTICQNRNSIPSSPKVSVGTFKPHEYEEFQNYITRVNICIGRKVYVTIPELCYLGIILNIEVGFLLHVNSIEHSAYNFRFGLTKSLNDNLAKILNACIIKADIKEEVKLVKHLIKLLHKEHFGDVSPRVSYHVSSSSSDPLIGQSFQIVRPYSEPDPLLPIYQTFQCDICLKSFINSGTARKHVNSSHRTLLSGRYTKSYISRSYSQMCFKGLITVLASARYELSQYLLTQGNITLVDFTDTELNLELEKVALRNDLKDFTVNRIAEYDDMFKHNYIVKLINRLDHTTLAFYLDYCMVDTQLRRFQFILTTLVSGYLRDIAATYNYNRALSVHRKRCLKFYMSASRRTSFIFTKISNEEHISEYATIASNALVILLAVYNLKKKSFPSLCDKPGYKVSFDEHQNEILDNILKLCLQISSLEGDTIAEWKLSQQDLIQFWSELQTLMISITLQKSSDRTPMQAIFTFSICSYDVGTRKLDFFRPRKRRAVFKALLYLMRSSILGAVNDNNDIRMMNDIQTATQVGELRKIMERMYYPTTYYFVKSKKGELKPFFNPQKYLYTHPVFLEDKIIGFKILGLYSIRLMLDRTAELLDSELKYVKQLLEMESPGKVVSNLSTLKRSLDEGVDAFFLELKRSMAGITCLLIGYLMLTNSPLPSFSHYLKIKASSLTFCGDTMKIETDDTIFHINEEKAIKRFGEYTSLKVHLRMLEPLAVPDDSTFMNLKYVRARTFLDLVSCNYTDHLNFYEFLTECQDHCRKETGNMGNNSQNWLKLIASAERVPSEGYLVVNINQFAVDYQKFALGGEYINTVDPRNLIPCNDDVDLNGLIEKGFFDDVIDEREENNFEEEDETCDVTFDFNEYSEMDITMNEEDYEDLVKQIKMKPRGRQGQGSEKRAKT